MDETSLFWKTSLNRTLSTHLRVGRKKAKDRIILTLTCNVDSSDKVEVWVIRKSKNPRCFKNLNRYMFRVQYRYNKSKWITGLIIEEYLHWLNNKIKAQGRKILLLIDNFSGYKVRV
jgi:hypothetical protein